MLNKHMMYKNRLNKSVMDENRLNNYSMDENRLNKPMIDENRLNKCIMDRPNKSIILLKYDLFERCSYGFPCTLFILLFYVVIRCLFI